MKLKNIKVGDTVEVKKSILNDRRNDLLKPNDLCKVIYTEPLDYIGGLTVHVSVNGIKEWVSHKHLRKPRAKQLDQDDDIAKELLEVDLNSELTGSELCKAMLARGDKYVMCFVNDKCEEAAKNYKRVRVIHSHGVDYFDDTTEDMWDFAIPINNQGEPLTAKDVGI